MKPEIVKAEKRGCSTDGASDSAELAALIRRARGLLERNPPGTSAAAAGSGISLCMIVRNEERHLARCLQSAAPLAQEIVVVDTGSTDRTREIALGFGARVFDLPWANDFSRARNLSLEQARGKWILVLDADEVIAKSDHERLRRLIGGNAPAAAAYSIRTRNYTACMNVVGWQPNTGEYPAEEAGMGWYPSDKVRLFPNDPAIRFENAVHEMVEASLRRIGWPIFACPVPVHHYGKLEEDVAPRKTRLYSEIGEGKLAGAPGDPAALRELAIQAAQLERHAEALALWERLLESGYETAEGHVNMGTALWNLGRYEAAVRSAEAAIRIDPGMKEARFNLAMAELHCGRAERAAGILERLLQRHPGYAAGQFLLSAACGCIGELRKAQAAIQPLRATALGAHLSVSFLDLARRLDSARLKAYARAVCAVAVKGGFADADLRAWLDGHERGDGARGLPGPDTPAETAPGPVSTLPA